MSTGSPGASPAPSLLTSAERTRLICILGMLGSNQGGERAAAGLFASRMLRERGLTWDALIVGCEAPGTMQSSAQDGQLDLDLCLQHPEHLTAWEGRFVAALMRRRGPPMPGQVAKLAQIATSLRGRGLS